MGFVPEHLSHLQAPSAPCLHEAGFGGSLQAPPTCFSLRSAPRLRSSTEKTFYLAGADLSAPRQNLSIPAETIISWLLHEYHVVYSHTFVKINELLMTTLTALSILIGKKRAIKVKDNFKFFPHRQCPQGSLGEAPTRRDRCQVSQLHICVLGADQLRHQQHGPLALGTQSPHLQQEDILLHGAREGQRERAPWGPHAERWAVAGRVQPSQPAQNWGGTGLAASACPDTNPEMARFLLGKPGEASSSSPDSETGCTYLAPSSSRGENPGAQQHETVEKETSTTESRASCLCTHQRCFLLCQRTDSEASLRAGLPQNPRPG